MSNDDDIPVLTDPLERDRLPARAPSSEELERLEARISASSLKLAEEFLRSASREAEHVLIERVMSELRAALPGIVRRALDEHFER